MATNKRFAVFDSDSHVVEPRELWEDYLDPEYRTLGKSALWREHGKNNSYLKVNGKVFRDTSNPNIPRHAIWQPGMSWEDVGGLDPNIRHQEVAGASDPQARLADMDAMGVDKAFLFPTWFAEGFHLVEDPDVANALARAYNDWMADFCKAAPDRLFAAAMVPPAGYGHDRRGTAEGVAEPQLPRGVHPPDVPRGALFHPPLLRSPVG